VMSRDMCLRCLGTWVSFVGGSASGRAGCFGCAK
jgi:hypothetical protein